MKKIELRSRNLLRKVFNGISVTSIAFTFQACYGMPPDIDCDVRFMGTVISKTTNLPVEGIKVALNDGVLYGFTNKNGKFDIYARKWELDCEQCANNKVNIHFLDVDGADNGHFADKTISITKPGCDGEVDVNRVELVEKE